MEYFERYEGGEKAILVHLNITHLNDPDDLEEFELLVDSAGAQKQALVTGTRSSLTPNILLVRVKLKKSGNLLSNTRQILSFLTIV